MLVDPDRSVDDILASAYQVLSFARQGAADYAEGGARMASGLHNAVTCGRSVTFVLQNLTHKVTGWEQWYEPIQSSLQADPVAKWFKELRNVMEKQGSVGPARFKTQIHFDSDVVFEALPADATGDLSIDAMGRLSYEVLLPDGTKQTIYAQLPPDMARVELELASAPTAASTTELLDHYLTRLGDIVDQAQARWGTRH